MTTKRFKILAIIFFAAPLLVVGMFSGPSGTVVSAMGDDPAAARAAQPGPLATVTGP